MTLLVGALGAGAALLGQWLVGKRDRLRAADDREADRHHSLWEQSRPAAERVVELMQSVIELSSRYPWEMPEGQAFSEEFSEWWRGKRLAAERDSALIPSAEVRTMLTDVLGGLDTAWMVSKFGLQGSDEIAARNAAHLGFEIASAWLRDELPDDDVRKRLDSLRSDVADATSQQEDEWQAIEEASRERRASTPNPSE